METITITLSRDEFDALLILMGYAIGAALGKQNKGLANMFIQVVNTVNKDNPGFIPYALMREGAGNKITEVLKADE